AHGPPPTHRPAQPMRRGGPPPTHKPTPPTAFGLTAAEAGAQVPTLAVWLSVASHAPGCARRDVARRAFRGDAQPQPAHTCAGTDIGEAPPVRPRTASPAPRT